MVLATAAGDNEKDYAGEEHTGDRGSKRLEIAFALEIGALTKILSLVVRAGGQLIELLADNEVTVTN